jgi:hypothetical protein
MLPEAIEYILAMNPRPLARALRTKFLGRKGNLSETQWKSLLAQLADEQQRNMLLRQHLPHHHLLPHAAVPGTSGTSPFCNGSFRSIQVSFLFVL